MYNGKVVSAEEAKLALTTLGGGETLVWHITGPNSSLGASFTVEDAAPEYPVSSTFDPRQVTRAVVHVLGSDDILVWTPSPWEPKGTLEFWGEEGTRMHENFTQAKCLRIPV